MSHPEGYEKDLEALGIHYIGEEFYNRDILIHEGVPAASVRVLDASIVYTEEEVRVISRELRRAEGTRIILVRSPPHAHRVKFLWKKLAGSDREGIVRPSPTEPYDGRH